MEDLTIFERVEKELIAKGYRFERKDFERPWGGFFVIEEDQKDQFISEYFSDLSSYNINTELKISPKILLVAPGKRLSWQYHHRRSEIWQVVEGPVGIIRSNSDLEDPMQEFAEEDLIQLDQGERHRLVGLQSWGMVAEIWIHTDQNHPSDENDIVRLQDDFARTTPA